MRSVIASGLLLTLLPNLVAAANCNAVISSNCACVVPALERRLGPAATEVVLESWKHAIESSAGAREEFFWSRRADINRHVLQYGRVKQEIAWECGTLNLPSDGLD